MIPKVDALRCRVGKRGWRLVARGRRRGAWQHQPQLANYPQHKQPRTRAHVPRAADQEERQRIEQRVAGRVHAVAEGQACDGAGAAAERGYHLVVPSYTKQSFGWNGGMPEVLPHRQDAARTLPSTAQAQHPCVPTPSGGAPAAVSRSRTAAGSRATAASVSNCTSGRNRSTVSNTALEH